MRKKAEKFAIAKKCVAEIRRDQRTHPKKKTSWKEKKMAKTIQSAIQEKMLPKIASATSLFCALSTFFKVKLKSVRMCRFALVLVSVSVCLRFFFFLLSFAFLPILSLSCFSNLSLSLVSPIAAYAILHVWQTQKIIKKYKKKKRRGIKYHQDRNELLSVTLCWLEFLGELQYMCVMRCTALLKTIYYIEAFVYNISNILLSHKNKILKNGRRHVLSTSTHDIKQKFRNIPAKLL